MNALASGERKCFSDSTAAEENGKKFIIERGKFKKEQFCKIKVDSCLVLGTNSHKCDYVFVRCSNQDFYFVELKGSNVDWAVEQIQSSIQYFKQHFTLQPKQIHAYIVSSGVPESANLKFRKKQFEFKKIGQELERSTNQYIKHL